MDLNPLDDYTFRNQRLNRAVYLAILVVAFLLRVPHFSPLAVVGVDTGIYVYCAENGYFPHAPYLVHSLIGLAMKPFVRLDWGFSAVSMISSLISILFFSWTMERLYQSRVAGWVAGVVLACTPICIRFAGIQEIYALQFLFLSWTWYVCSAGHHPLLAGLLFGTTMATHTGTIFTLPATLLLLWNVTYARAVTGITNGVVTSHSGSFMQTSRWVCIKSLIIFLISAAVVGLLAVSWVVYLWMTTPGAPELSSLPVFLRGYAPSFDWYRFSQGGVIHQIFVQTQRVWRDLADPHVIGSKLLGFSLLALLLQPWRLSAPWWLLSIPYILYEVLITYSLDAGVYCVFIVPAFAAGLGLSSIIPSDSFYRHGILVLVLVFILLLFDTLDVSMAGVVVTVLVAAFLVGRTRFITTARVAVLLLGLFFAIDDVEDYQKTAKIRQLMSWYRNSGAPCVLSKWVRDNTPKDTIVCQPLDWLSSSYAVSLYSEREPLFRSAEKLALTPWRPLMHNFSFLSPVTVENIENWLSQGRPLVSFDPEPFTGYQTLWKAEFSERYEARPILWLDRNQSGTSSLWHRCQVIASVNIGDATSEQQAHLKIPATSKRGWLQALMYHPTLYWISRRTDTEVPVWVRELQSKVPSTQIGSPPVVVDDGIAIEESGACIIFELPAVPGRTHILRHRLQSGGLLQFITSCSIDIDGKWVRTGADMEQIFGPPDQQFTDFYYRVPGDHIGYDRVTLKLSAAFGCQEINVYHIDWAAAEEGALNPSGL